VDVALLICIVNLTFSLFSICVYLDCEDIQNTYKKTARYITRKFPNHCILLITPLVEGAEIVKI